jgi:4-amino-4-deoxy-L-arabinose transferase-like glycosyltransferase
MTREKQLLYSLLIIAIGSILFFPFLGAVHLFDWDEINFAECSREMLVTGNYSSVQINYLPFWEKPPLFFWMQSASMKLFGVNEFAARFPNAIAGILTLLLLFFISIRHFDAKFAFWWIAFYTGSLLPHFYFKSGIIDPWFNLFIFISVYAYFRYLLTKMSYGGWIALSAISIGLAVLTKGPVAVLVFMLVVFWFYVKHGFRNIITIPHFFLFLLLSIVTGSMWFASEIFQGRWQTLLDNIAYQIRLFSTQDAGHGGPFFYHWYILLIGCFPASIPFIMSFFIRQNQSYERKDFILLMKILFWVVLILFSIVKTKIVHYSSLCYFPITFLAAYHLYYSERGLNLWNKLAGFFQVLISILLGLTFMILPFFDAIKLYLLEKGFIKDAFAKEAIQAQSNWSGYEWIIGLLFLVVSIVAGIRLKENLAQAFRIYLINSTISISLLLIFYVPNIERYSQGAAIDFYKSLEGQDCYVETYGFKSYAQYFYSKKMPVSNKESYDIYWLMSENIDKPTYVVTKKKDKAYMLEHYQQMEIISEKNGFIFWKNKKI